MKESKLRRHQDIIAFRDPSDPPDEYVAFHASNLEVAQISHETYEEMSDITLKNGEIPTLKETKILEVKNQLNDWNHEINPDVKAGKLGFEVRSLTINITQICNLHCAYCAAGGDGTYGNPVTRISVEKTIPQLKYFIESMKPNRKFTISFVGGEPLLYPEGIFALAEYVLEASTAKNITPSFSVVTNGTIVNEKVLDLIQKIKLNLTISMDGDAKINDRLRPSKDKHSTTTKILENLKKLEPYKNQLASIGISSVYSDPEQNLLDMYHFFKGLNVDWYEFNFDHKVQNQELQNQYVEGLQQVAEEAWQTGGETELKKIRQINHYFHLLDQQQQIENFCGSGKSFLMMDAQNNLYACPWVVGDKNEVVGQGNTLNYDKLTEYQKPLIESNNCQTCWARYLCGGGCMFIHKEATGDRHVKDTLFCERTRGLILLVLLYYKRARRGAL